MALCNFALYSCKVIYILKQAGKFSDLQISEQMHFALVKKQATPPPKKNQNKTKTNKQKKTNKNKKQRKTTSSNNIKHQTIPSPKKRTQSKTKQTPLKKSGEGEGGGNKRKKRKWTKSEESIFTISNCHTLFWFVSHLVVLPFRLRAHTLNFCSITY